MEINQISIPWSPQDSCIWWFVPHTFHLNWAISSQTRSQNSRLIQWHLHGRIWPHRTRGGRQTSHFLWSCDCGCFAQALLPGWLRRSGIWTSRWLLCSRASLLAPEPWRCSLSVSQNPAGISKWNGARAPHTRTYVWDWQICEWRQHFHIAKRSTNLPWLGSLPRQWEHNSWLDPWWGACWSQACEAVFQCKKKTLAMWLQWHQGRIIWWTLACTLQPWGYWHLPSQFFLAFDIHRHSNWMRGADYPFVRASPRASPPTRFESNSIKVIKMLSHCHRCLELTGTCMWFCWEVLGQE